MTKVEKVSVDFKVAASPQKVWAILSQPENYPDYFNTIDRVDIVDNQEFSQGYSWSECSAGNSEGVVRTVSYAHEPKYLVLTWQQAGVSYELSYLIKPEPYGSFVVIENSCTLESAKFLEKIRYDLKKLTDNLFDVESLRHDILQLAAAAESLD